MNASPRHADCIINKSEKLFPKIPYRRNCRKDLLQDKFESKITLSDIMDCLLQLLTKHEVKLAMNLVDYLSSKPILAEASVDISKTHFAQELHEFAVQCKDTMLSATADEIVGFIDGSSGQQKEPKWSTLPQPERATRVFRPAKESWSHMNTHSDDSDSGLKNCRDLFNDDDLGMPQRRTVQLASFQRRYNAETSIKAGRPRPDKPKGFRKYRPFVRNFLSTGEQEGKQGNSHATLFVSKGASGTASTIDVLPDYTTVFTTRRSANDVVLPRRIEQDLSSEASDDKLSIVSDSEQDSAR